MKPMFDSTGGGYDDARAQQAGMTPAGPEAGRDAGHMGSVAETTPEEQERYGVPPGSYIMLKGEGHPTWNKAVEAEQSRGFKVVKRGDRYFSVPAEQPRMKPIKPNKRGMMMANLLRRGRDLGNVPGQLPEGVPLVGGMGVGDLLFGQTPEMTEDWAHGFPPWTGQGYGFKIKPEAIDYVGLPLAGTGGAIANRALIRGLRSAGGQTTREGSRGIMGALQRGADMPTDESRRNVLKGLGAAGAVVAMPKMLRGLPDNVVGDAAVKVAPKVVNTYTKISRNIMERMYDNADMLDKDAAVTARKIIDGMDPAQFEDLNKYVESLDWTKAAPGAEKRLVSHPDVMPEDYGLPRDSIEIPTRADGNIDYGNLTPEQAIVEAAQEEAKAALNDLNAQELGNWIISGQPPASMKRHLPYLNTEDIGMAVDGKTPISFNNSSSDTDWMLVLDEALETNSRGGGF